jgi:hypothetical protein
MTEQDWLVCQDPEKMLPELIGKLSERKWRLFAVACCRRLQGLLRQTPGWEDVLAAELLADGRLAEAERQRHYQRARKAATPFEDQPALAAAFAALHTTGALAAAWASHKAVLARGKAHQAAEKQAQADLLRDIAGNPYRPVVIDLGWAALNAGSARRVAAAIYEEQAFDQLPVLADALEDAGCADADILDHCRRPGVHVRGCWVVDWLLEME